MCKNDHCGSTAIGFLVGGAIGAGLALLYAPTSGEETRRRLREQAEKAKNCTKESYEATLAEIEERIETLKSSLQEKKDEVKAAYEGGKDAFYKEKAKHQEA